MPRAIVVLNDGETYSDIRGTNIMVLTDQAFEMLESGYDPNDLPEKVIIERTPIEVKE